MIEKTEKFDANEMLARIDERVKHIQTVDMSEIRKHLETLNDSVAKNTGRSLRNEVSVKLQWALLGVVVAGIVTMIVEIIKI